jgi:alpha-glucoside transport system substrate-binding protein
MTRQQPKWRTLLAFGAAFSLLAAACADDSDDDDDVVVEDPDDDAAPEDVDLEGEVVSIFGPEIDTEQQSLDETFDPFGEATGVQVDVAGADDFETQITVDVDGGNPPDIALFPQPGAVVTDFVDDIAPLTDAVLAEVEANFDEGWTSLVEVDGQIVGVPIKADLKSLVWYSPDEFEANDYEVPETLDDFYALADQMVDDGNVPFCLGWESDDATGWPATDWMEDWMLRMHGPDTYDAWRLNEIPFDDPDVVEVGEFLYDFWTTDGYVLDGFEGAASRSFRDAGVPILDGDCMMYRLSNFYGAILGEEDAELGPDGDADAFYLPGSDEHPNITLTAGMYAVAFNDDPATMATLEYIASTEFADTRAANPIGGFLSPNANVDASLYTTEMDQQFGQILAEADPARFDASDLMPAAVGSGTFWEAMVNITTGSQTVEEAFSQVEDDWRD